MSKAFVAGATGYTGKQVVSQLCAAGVETIAHVRPDSPKLDAMRSHFEALGARVDTTPWNSSAIQQTIGTLQPHLIFGLLGTTQKRARSAAKKGLPREDESYATVDCGYTTMLIDAGTQLQQKPRFIYLSSLGVSSTAVGSYLQARYKTERHLLESGLPCVIARPCFISGNDRQERRPLERAASTLIDGALSTLSLLGQARLRKRYGSIDATTLARALVRLSLEPEAPNSIIESEFLG